MKSRNTFERLRVSELGTREERRREANHNSLCYTCSEMLRSIRALEANHQKHDARMSRSQNKRLMGRKVCLRDLPSDHARRLNSWTCDFPFAYKVEELHWFLGGF